MNTLQILKAGKAKIISPENFTVRVYARDCERNQVSPTSIYATCWCSLGALAAVTGMNGSDMQSSDDSEVGRAVKRLRTEMRDVIGFSDNHLHSVVMVRWDRAIAAEEAA